MKKLVFQRLDPQAVDVARIVRIFHTRGFEVSAEDARLAWEEHSESMAAGWLFLSDNDDIVFLTLRHRFAELEGDDQ